ncbi:hypothetical protein LCGC14_2232190, partial [marine sediment metagenome]
TVEELRAEVLERAESGGDVRLHMERFFDTVLEWKPTLIVELGIRGGVSSFALERGARLVGAKMICVDINDCSGVLDYAEFVQADDVVFARRFRAFCRRRGIKPSVDMLMVDTSHTYIHTQQEIRSWLPLMSPRCLMMFHDTNASQFGYGVAAYLREWLDIPFPEGLNFTAESGGWWVEHHPECFGLTILRRV